MFDMNRRPIGNTGRYARTCDAGTARLRAMKCRLGYKSSATVAYIFARFRDPVVGRIRREELGRFLLATAQPVEHANGDPLDFRLDNLRPTERIRRTKIRAPKPEPPVLNSAETIAAQEEQLGNLLPELYRIAGAILQRNSLPEETVHEVLLGMLMQIRKGTIRDLAHFAKRVVRFHARRKQKAGNAVSDIEHDPAQRAVCEWATSQVPTSQRPIALATNPDGFAFVMQTAGAKRKSLTHFDNIEYYDKSKRASR